MANVLRSIVRWLRCERALSQIEYALLLALLTVGLVTLWSLLGDMIEANFLNTNSDLKTAVCRIIHALPAPPILTMPAT